ncbi:MAG TPA: glycosyltransferase family 1 protein [Candidatus Sulfotelmatobacter sp.]|nr:glycosyltransferase family 1 protein [Candidatus Sulfotelmatobacter sp.]
MIHLFINALAASAGGGLTYVRNVIPQIAARTDARATVVLDAGLRREFRTSPNVEFVEWEGSLRPALRFWREQRVVREFARRSGAGVLLSAGNFAIWNSPLPQLLLSRNALYTSRDFDADLRSRGEYRLWLDNRLKAEFAEWSIHASDRVVAPSQSFAEELQRWTGKPVSAIHHGFDRDTFLRDHSALPDAVRRKLETPDGALRMLFVSHYNYYRNFETLLRALPSIRQELAPRPIRLFLTCKLAPGANPGAYNPEQAAALVRQLKLSEEVVELGSVPYALLHHVYRSADVYVTPAYAETFAHPLVEAMSSGLPVVASDLSVHREICGTAGVYFHRFSPEELAQLVITVAGSSELATRLAQAGIERASEFSWKRHVDQILSLAREIGTDCEARARRELM